MNTSAEATEAKTPEQWAAEAIALGWKRRPDGDWSKGRGSHYRRVRSAENAVAAEKASSQ
jgi:hypothetical protein